MVRRRVFIDLIGRPSLETISLDGTVIVACDINAVGLARRSDASGTGIFPVSLTTKFSLPASIAGDCSSES